MYYDCHAPVWKNTAFSPWLLYTVARYREIKFQTSDCTVTFAIITDNDY